MSNQLFTNEIIISWLQYFAKYAVIDLEKVKMLDITRGNKNLIPTVQSHQAVLVFTEAGDHDIFYRMWNVGLGDCEVWYNEGSEPTGEMKHDKLCDMIDRGINANAGMLIVNPNAVNSSKIGMDNSNSTIADLITDGCNMGVKSLGRYLNQYEAADEKSKDICKRLMNLEEKLAQDLRRFL